MMTDTIMTIFFGSGVLLVGFAIRERWFSDQTDQFVRLAPFMDRLEELALVVQDGEKEKFRFASHFDYMVHMYFSSAFSGRSARELLERRLHSVLNEVSRKGFDPVAVFEADKYAQSRVFLRVQPSWGRRNTR